MCGIGGVFHFDAGRPVDVSVLEGMNSVQRHRGPDDGGLYLNGRVGLANRRLAIVDRPLGRQPMCNADGSAWITYNGEVFNHQALRRELCGLGFSFKTHSDTEVVLRAYEAFGEDCVERFNGQFAFAIWDGPKSKLFLARDRMGIAPIHYTVDRERFVFASEAKAILGPSGIEPRIDREAVAEALLCGTLFHGRTMFEGVRTLEPGYTLTVSPNGCRLRRYWEIPRCVDRSSEDDESYYADRLLPLVTDALQIRMRGEVPWGIMLSGGTDSSTLTALASRASSTVQTFTVDFPNRFKGLDTDAAYARLVASRLGTEHHELMLDPRDYYSVLERVIWHVERPFNKGAATMFLLYRMLKERATVVITGEGADELFAGYVGARGLGLEDILSSGRITQLPWAAYWEDTNRLFSRDFNAEVRPAELFRERLADCLRAAGDDADPLNRGLYLYARYFLLELLELHDRTSLAFGVEARLPFIDHRLVELIAPMPSELKYRNGQSKYLLKKAIVDLVPGEIINRRKTPLPIPRDPETVQNQIELTRELLCGPDSRTARYYDRHRLEAFLDLTTTDTLAVWKVTMHLITLEMLHRVYGL